MTTKPSYEELEQRVRELTEMVSGGRHAAGNEDPVQGHVQRILDCAPSVIYTKDLQGRYTLINAQFENLSGKKKAEVIGKTDFDLFPASVAENATENDRKVIETGAPLEIEEFGPVNGKMHAFASTKYPLKSADGRVNGICGISKDLHEIRAAKAETEREQVLSQLKATLDATAEGILVVGLNGTIRLASKKFAGMWAVPESLLASANAEDVLAHVLEQLEDPASFLRKIRSVVSKTESSSSDRLQLTDGRVIECSSSPQRLRGEMIGRVWSFRDVTDQAAAEKELTDLNETMDLAQKMAGIGYWSYDIASGKRIWSSQMYVIFGADPAAGPPPFEAIRELFDPRDGKIYENNIENALEGIPYDQVARIRFPGGAVRYVHTQGYPRTDQSGKIVGLFGTSKDITDRVLAEKALKDSEEKFRNIFENSIVGIFQSTPEGRFINANDAFVKMLGYDSPAELISTITDIETQYYANPGDRRRYRKRLDETGSVENFEFMVNRKDGTTTWVSNSTRAYFDDEGRVSYYEGVVVDISERKQLEKKLIASRKTEAFSILAGGLAHDYNNLLSVIWGNISLLRDRLEDDASREFFEEAEKACVQARALTHKFMTLSLGARLKKSTQQIRPLLEAVLAETGEAAGLDVSLQLPHDLPAVEIDPELLGIVFKNIVKNAAEACPAGGTLKIEAAVETGGHDGTGRPGRLRLVFSDSGKGVARSNLLNVFDPYFTTKKLDARKGLGLGLAVAQAVVLKHGGDIRIDSTLGEGTTVTITLPLPVAESQKRPEPDLTETADRPMVLLLEDDSSLRKMCELMLTKMDCQVISAGDGKEAVEKYREAVDKGRGVDLAFLDQNIPGGMGGTETLRKLKRLGYKGHAIVVTGSPDSPVILNYREYGFDGKLLKPFTRKDLADTIDGLLGARS